MPKRNEPDRQPAQGVKPKSLTLHLATSFMTRQMTIFIIMDVMLLLLAAASIFVWAEVRCNDVAKLVEQRGVPSADAMVWMQALDYMVTSPENTPQYPNQVGFYIDELPFLDHVVQGLRTTDGISYYTVLAQGGDHPYSITLNLSSGMQIIKWIFIVMAAVQLLVLLTNAFGSSRAIHRTLRPLQELAATAVRLNSTSSMSRQEMETLAGELDKISAQDLDSRIDVPTTQRELRSLALAINSMLDRVNKAYRSQMQFVSDASHELRTPIAVVQGYASLLDRWGKTDPETRQEAIDAIRSEAVAMQRLVEQLLFLARGDNESQPVKKERFDLTVLASEVLRDEILIHQDRMILPSWEEPVYIEADPALIKQVMRILMDNSIKYSPSDGNVWLRVARREGYARVTVQDEGMGMAPGALTHIFDRFYRTDESRARTTGGTGLGLSIAKWIIHKHEGWFEVVSREDFGTRMSFMIPLAGEKEPDLASPQDYEIKLNL